MDALFMIAYAVIPLAIWWRSRSVTWTVVSLLVSVSFFGALVSFSVDHVVLWTRAGLQWTLLAAFVTPLVLAFMRRPVADSPRRFQIMSVGVPVVLLGVYFAIVTTLWTDVPAYETPVSFLMGHSLAEDNAKWLDFTAAYAAGGQIDQYVPMGGPLQLFLTLVGTAMGVLSQVTLGGFNEVFVAANSVVYAQYTLVVLAPLALAPLVGARWRSPVEGGGGFRRIPVPLLWLGAAVLVIANLMLTAYGHLTLQFTILVCAVWVATFLGWGTGSRARFFVTLAVAITMTVWLPLNAIALVIVVGGILFTLSRVAMNRSVGDVINLGAVVLVAVALWEPLRSSLVYALAIPEAASGGAAGGGVHASVLPPVLTSWLAVPAGIDESTLFAAGGGTEQTTAIQALLAAAALVAAAVVVSRQRVGRQAYWRFLPVLLLGGFALALNGMDQWATGSAPHYGSYKFTFMVTMVLLAVLLPVALLLLDPRARGMTLARWAAIGAVLLALTVDSLLVRSIAAARPDQWSPPVPFDNPQSYWWPADVNGTADQPIKDNPVGCVYLPQGAKSPSAILDSQLSDPQRVYSCTRLLAGLAGVDGPAQPLVDWLRREWLTNTRAWSTVHQYLAEMPDEARERPVILLDDGSNVVGLETIQSLLVRFPRDVEQAG